jgi:hypothetical protein
VRDDRKLAALTSGYARFGPTRHMDTQGQMHALEDKVTEMAQDATKAVEGARRFETRFIPSQSEFGCVRIRPSRQL